MHTINILLVLIITTEFMSPQFNNEFDDNIQKINQPENIFLSLSGKKRIIFSNPLIK
jgi:hypothetical protein